MYSFEYVLQIVNIYIVLTRNQRVHIYAGNSDQINNTYILRLRVKSIFINMEIFHKYNILTVPLKSSESWLLAIPIFSPVSRFKKKI